MVMTTGALHFDLAKIETLIAALAASYPGDAEDLDDVSWLEERRAFLLSLLASRRLLKRNRVVRLDQWRDGVFVDGRRAAKAA